MIAAVHLLLGRIVAVAVIAVAASGAIVAVHVAADRPPAATASMSVAGLVDRLAAHGTLARLTQTPAGGLVAQFSEPRLRAAVDPGSGALLPLQPPGDLERVATEIHRSLTLGSDGGRLAVAATSTATLVLAVTGLALLSRRTRRPGAVAASHRWLGLGFCLPLVLSCVTGLMLTAASLFPVAVDGLRPPFVPASGAGRPLDVREIAALRRVPVRDLEDLVLPGADDREDSYRLTTAAAFIDIDPATGAVLASAARPVWHRVAATARRVHAGYGQPAIAGLFGLASVALVWAAVSGLAIDLGALRARRGGDARAAAGSGTVVLYGTARGTTRVFAERLAACLAAAGQPVEVAPMNDLAPAHGAAARLVLVTATDGAGVAPPTADRFLDRLAELDRVPPFAVLGFGERRAVRFCGFAEDVAAALLQRGGRPIVPLGRIHRRSEEDFSAWAASLVAATGGAPAALPTPAADRRPPETRRRVLSGPGMGSHWTATVHVAPGMDTGALTADLAARVGAIEAALSRFRVGSDVLRLDAAPVGRWIAVSDDCVRVLAAGLDIGRRSGGAFDIGLAAEVAAQGFGVGWIASGGARRGDRRPAHAAIEVDVAGRRVLKRSPVAIDLAGIAKGYAVDELARVVAEAGFASHLVALDGEVRAGAPQPDGRPWAVGVEAPIVGRRELVGRIDLVDRAAATSGDHRRVTADGRGHTLDPETGEPRRGGPAAVTVLAATCMEADAWATALLVSGRAGLAAARAAGVEAIFTDTATAASPASFPQPEPARCTRSTA